MCKKLREITLSRNNLSGQLIPTGCKIACATTLQQLNLHENMISGPFPQEICTCLKLTSLDLSQ